MGELYKRLSAVGDPLEKLNGIISWPVFEKPLAMALKWPDGAKRGQIVDAKIIQAPKQDNNQDEKAAISVGKIPPEWKDKPANLAQGDRDAPWTVTYSKARQPTGRRHQPPRSSMTLPFRCSVTRTMPALTGRTA